MRMLSSARSPPRWHSLHVAHTEQTAVFGDSAHWRQPMHRAQVILRLRVPASGSLGDSHSGEN